MNLEDTLRALDELRANARGRIMMRMKGDWSMTQRCVVCDAEEDVVMELSDEGDERLLAALRKFQDAHRHEGGPA